MWQTQSFTPILRLQNNPIMYDSLLQRWKRRLSCAKQLVWCHTSNSRTRIPFQVQTQLMLFCVPGHHSCKLQRINVFYFCRQNACTFIIKMTILDLSVFWEIKKKTETLLFLDIPSELLPLFLKFPLQMEINNNTVN